MEECWTETLNIFAGLGLFEILQKLFFFDFRSIELHNSIGRTSQKIILFPVVCTFLTFDLYNFEQCLTLILDVFLFSIYQHIQVEIINI